MSSVTYIGLGYIGLPTAILTAKSGFNTFGYDIDINKIDKIKEGDFFSKEINLKTELNLALNSGKLKLYPEIKKSSIYVIVVPTPLLENNQPDISIVQNAIEQVIPILSEGDLIIIESTCPVLTTDKMYEFISSRRPELQNNFFLAYCPERVLPGNILFELVNNDRIIGGINLESSKKAKKFYENFVKGNIHITNSRTAEMCKLTENSARDAQIAFANELSMICDQAGINVWELIDLANKHPRVNILKPGIGVGGHCIAVDPWFLVADFPLEAKLIKHVRETNKYKTFWSEKKIQKERDSFIERNKFEPKIACMGLAYKENIDDLRESPALKIVQSLINSDCEILLVEPNIIDHKFYKISNIDFAVNEADIIVWLVNHNEFSNLKISESKIQLDLCGLNL